MSSCFTRGTARHASPERRILRLALLMATALTPLFLGLQVSPALADGGAAGAGEQVGAGLNGAGGQDNTNSAGGAGGDGWSLYAGGGGGAGMTGGNGGTGDEVDGIGGVGGALPGQNGQDGGSIQGTANGGGGGGGGGAHGFIGSVSDLNADPDLAASGGNGGKGGDGSPLYRGQGGGGGSGGYGAVLDPGASGMVNVSITGGDGGAGGAAPTIDYTIYNGGNGGSGGTGLVAQGGGSLVINGDIKGGKGGDAGTTAVGPFAAQAGNGGAGFIGSGLTLEIGATKSIVGGDGGLADLKFTTGFGLGGAGIVGSDLSVINAGTISGGLGGDGGQADAIRFTSGDNRLELRDGTASVVGNVVVEIGANGTLALGGVSTASAFDMGAFDTQYQGFTALEKVGSGTWTLTGADNAGRGWTITNGTLKASTDSLKGDVTFAASGADPVNLVFNPSNGSYGGNISGAGNVTFFGAGARVLNGLNTYTGTTTIESARLQAGSAAALSAGSTYDLADSIASLELQTFDSTIGGLEGSGTVDLAGATLTVGGNNDTTEFSGDIAGTTGSLIKVGTGTLTLRGDQTYSGDTTINDGTLALGSGAAFNSAGFTIINTGGTFDLGGTTQTQADVELNGGTLKNGGLNATISSSGGFISGLGGAANLLNLGGVTEITGTNTYSGATNVNAGTLIVNGSIMSVLTVNAGGRLGGTGTLGATVIAANGTHAPGNSIGTQTILGNYTNHGVLQIEVDPSHADKLVVGGTVDITGARLDILLSSNDAAMWASNASPYTIIANGSGTAVIGSFAPLADLVFLTADLNYAGGDGNDIDLTLTRNSTSFLSVAASANQQAVATAVEASGSGTVYDAIVASNDIDLVRRSFDALSGEVHASLQGVLLGQSDIVNEAMTDRLRSAFDGVAASGAPVLSYGPNGPEFTAADTGDLVVWAQGIGAWREVDGNENAARIETSIGGLTAGADTLVGDWRLGLLAGYSQSSFEIDDRASSGDSDNYLLGLYGGTQLGGLGMRTGLAYGWHDVSTSRTVPLLNQTLTADYGANTVQAFGELGYGFELGNAVRFEPYANLAYVRLDTDGFSESGGSAALSSNGSTADAAFTTIGLRASTQMAWGETLATLRGGVGWRHAFTDDPSTLNALTGGTDFTITGTPLTEDSAVVEAGLDLDLSTNANLGMTYSSQFGAGDQNHGLSAKLAVGF